MDGHSGNSINIYLLNGLPCITAVIRYRDQSIRLENVLLDTGSAGTIFPTDRLAEIGITYEPDDKVHRVRGVGGSEFVFSKQVDELSIDAFGISTLVIEIGAMDYGLPINGIIGMDFLTQAKAVIDLGEMEIRL